MTGLKPERRDRLKRRLDEMPDLAALVGTMHNTLMPRRAGGGGARPHPGSRPPVNLGIVDLFDNRPKLNGRTVVDATELTDRVTAELWAARQRADHRMYLEDGKAKRANPDTISDEAKGRRVGVLLCLEAWVRVASEEMDEVGESHTPPREDPTVSSEAGWLSQHIGWISEQRWSDDLDRDVSQLWQDMRQLVGEGQRQFVATCTRPGCGSAMRDDGPYFTCPACGQQERDSRMSDRADLANQRPVTGERIAGMFGINYSTIRKWDERKLLEPAVDEQGRPMMDGRKPLYHVIDVLRLADQSGLVGT